VRIKSKWYKSDQPKSPEEIASVLAFNGWKIAMNRLEHLESENFPITENRQRFGIVMEFLAYQLQAADRTAYGLMEEEDRQRLITRMALRFAEIVDENITDIAGPGDYKRLFIDLVNQRSADYAGLTYGEDGPGYSFNRYLADRVAEAVGEQSNKWIREQVAEIEAPEAFKLMRKSFNDQLG